MSGSEKRITLVDQVKKRADDQGNEKRTPRYAV
jgi:hypothetical protein